MPYILVKETAPLSQSFISSVSGARNSLFNVYLKDLMRPKLPSNLFCLWYPSGTLVTQTPISSNQFSRTKSNRSETDVDTKKSYQ